MAGRATISPAIIADLLVRCRRRCCICFALAHDSIEKKGQVAHLDRDPSNKSGENLAFLCLEHHDQYDSSTSQSKGLSTAEIKQYRAQLERFVVDTLPLSDAEGPRPCGCPGSARLSNSVPTGEFVAALPRGDCRDNAVINTGMTINERKLPGKNDVRDSRIREALDRVVEPLVALRATFDELMRSNEIRHCGCADPDCPVFMLSHRGVQEMDRRRRELLGVAGKLVPDLPVELYNL